MRWLEDPSPGSGVRPLPARWTAAFVAATALGLALVGGITATTPTGAQRHYDGGSALATDPATEPTGRAGLPHGHAARTSEVTEAPAAPPIPQVVLQVATAGTTAPTPPPVAAVAPAEPVPVGSPGKPCAAEGGTGVTDAGQPLVCTTRGGGRPRWHQA